MNINEKIYRNVKALCKMDGKDLKDVEREIGRAPGYLSRKNTKVDVEMLMKLAELFEISPEELMNLDYEHELVLKEAVDELKSAVLRAKLYFNEDAIMNVISPLIEQGEA
jgi:transcriptional regulator with XRE-family HTH domain